MWVVHKIELQTGLGHYSLPIGSELLHVAMQRGEAVLWYRRPVLSPGREDRTILFTGTGCEEKDAPRGSEYAFIGTMMSEDQNFVFHVFELVPLAARTTGEQLAGEGR